MLTNSETDRFEILFAFLKFAFWLSDKNTNDLKTKLKVVREGRSKLQIAS